MERVGSFWIVLEERRSLNISTINSVTGLKPLPPIISPRLSYNGLVILIATFFFPFFRDTPITLLDECYRIRGILSTFFYKPYDFVSTALFKVFDLIKRIRSDKNSFHGAPRENLSDHSRF